MWGDILCTVGGNHDKCGGILSIVGCSVPWGYHDARGGYHEYRGGKTFCYLSTPTVLNTAQRY